jgi:DNA replication and repair protein RecF
MEIEPHNEINVIYGQNGQGKTNLLEAIWLFTGCKSFRNAKDSELVQFNEENSRISIEYETETRENKASVCIEKKRTASLNGINLSSPRELIGKYYSVVFSPVHLSLIKDGPLNKRKFIDTAISQIDNMYAKKLMYFNHLIQQKNALLKNATENPSLLDTLDIWDEKIALAGADIISDRIEYIKRLQQKATEIYRGISGEKEELSIKYLSNVRYENEEKNSIAEKYYETMKKNRPNDLYLKNTTSGPHRDDIEILINGISARKFGSQGQERSASLALKLGEAEIIKDLKGEHPIILLDDVMSELDSTRQNYILNKMTGKQVFITCCEKETISKLCAGKVIKIEKGKAVD